MKTNEEENKLPTNETVAEPFVPVQDLPYDLYATYTDFDLNIEVDFKKRTIIKNVSNTDAIRYLKGIFTNRERFIGRFINKFKTRLAEEEEFVWMDYLNEWLDEWVAIYDEVKAFTYTEAFRLEDETFKALVFGSINVPEMISALGHTRVATDGIKVKHKQFSPSGELLGIEEYDNIYEVHEVDTTKLESGIDKSYALKCWCTTTNKEHWLWIEDEHKDKPLEAIASTFRIQANLIPHIKELNRQGDILLVVMDEEGKNLTPEGEPVPLTAEQYFGLLTCQS